jgi:hypothetical protein
MPLACRFPLWENPLSGGPAQSCAPRNTQGFHALMVGLMAFNFEQCRSLLLDATLAELQANRATILKIPGFEAGGLEFRRHVSAICLDIAPWHRSFDLAFRDDDEKWDDRIRNSIGDWKLYPLRGAVGQPSTDQRAALEEFFDREYGTIENTNSAREIAHLMFLAAAEALFDHSVTTLLRQYQIDAPYVEDAFLPDKCFEYIVMDPDGSISANYCDIVIANRITQRLKLNFERID